MFFSSRGTFSKWGEGISRSYIKLYYAVDLRGGSGGVPWTSALQGRNLGEFVLGTPPGLGFGLRV